MKDTSEYHSGSGQPVHLDENELALYADFLRGDAESVPDRITDHVAACPYCRTELMSLTDLLDQLPDLAEEPYQPLTAASPSGTGRKQSALAMWLRTVAAVAAVGLLAWIVQRILPEGPGNEPVISAIEPDSSRQAVEKTVESVNIAGTPAAGDTVKKNTAGSRWNSKSKAEVLPDTLLYAEAYIPDPGYESLIGGVYRTGTNPRVQGPDPAATISPGDTLYFTWKPDPQDRYTLLFVNNRDSVMHAFDPGDSGSLRWPADLPPGLYYWKFLGTDDLWKVGRVKVMRK